MANIRTLLGDHKYFVDGFVNTNGKLNGSYCSMKKCYIGSTGKLFYTINTAWGKHPNIMGAISTSSSRTPPSVIVNCKSQALYGLASHGQTAEWSC